jgi:hypothetical protein
MADPPHPEQLPALAPAGEWNYINTVTAPPASGQIRLDNVTQTAATHVWVHKTTATTADASAALLAILKNQEISVYNKTDPTKGQVYAVTGIPIDGGSYVDYPVVWKRSGSGGAFPAQRTVLEVVSTPATVLIDGQSMQAGTTATTHKLGYAVELDVKCLTAHAGHLEVTGQLISFDYFHPFEGLHLTSAGITKRQWYAGQAMVGFISNAVAANLLYGQLAEWCFRAADSLIAHEAKEAAGITRPPAGGKQAPPAPVAPIAAAVGPPSVSEAQVAALRKKEADAA